MSAPGNDRLCTALRACTAELATGLLLVLTRRLPSSDPAIQVFGDKGTTRPLAPAHAVLTPTA